MSTASTAGNTPEAAIGPHAGARAPLARALAVVHALLPAGSRLALGWRDPELGEHFLAEPPAPVDLLSRLELA